MRSSMRSSSRQQTTSFKVDQSVLRFEPGVTKATITIRNSGAVAAVYKVRSVYPDNFSVRPHVGIIPASGKKGVLVSLRTGGPPEELAKKTKGKDFAVEVRPMDTDELAALRLDSTRHPFPEIAAALKLPATVQETGKAPPELAVLCWKRNSGAPFRHYIRYETVEPELEPKLQAALAGTAGAGRTAPDPDGEAIARQLARQESAAAGPAAESPPHGTAPRVGSSSSSWGVLLAAAGAAFAGVRAGSPSARRLLLAAASALAALWVYLRLRGGRQLPPQPRAAAQAQPAAAEPAGTPLDEHWERTAAEVPAARQQSLDHFAGYSASPRNKTGQGESAAPEEAAGGDNKEAYDANAAGLLLQHMERECTLPAPDWGGPERVLPCPDLRAGEVRLQCRTQGQREPAYFRASATIAASCDAVWELVRRTSSDLAAAQSQQPQIVTYDVLEAVECEEGEARVVHTTQLIPGLLEARDFVLLCAERRRPDGTGVAAMRSVEYPCAPRSSQHAGSKSLVRGKLIAGLHVTPSGNDCVVTRVLRMDTGGHKQRDADQLRAAEWAAGAQMRILELAVCAAPGRALPAAGEAAADWMLARQIALDFVAAAGDRNFRLAREVWVRQLNANVPLEHRPDRNNPGALGTWRAETEMEGSVDSFLSLLVEFSQSAEITRQLTPEMEFQSILREIHVAAHVVYKRDKLPWPLHRREFVFLTSLVVDKGGTVYMAQASVPKFQSLMTPDERRAIRGRINISGFRVQPVAGSGGRRVRVMQLVDAAPGGSLPQWLLAKAMDDRAHTLGRLHQLMKTRS